MLRNKSTQIVQSPGNLECSFFWFSYYEIDINDIDVVHNADVSEWYRIGFDDKLRIVWRYRRKINL